MLGIFLLFLAFVAGLMTYLALNGRVSSDALLFLVGTISGYVLVIVQRHPADNGDQPKLSGAILASSRYIRRRPFAAA